MTTRVARTRPAEGAGGIGAVATAVAALLHAPAETIAIIGTTAGVLPGIVTYLVAHGGMKGVVGSVWHGK